MNADEAVQIRVLRTTVVRVSGRLEEKSAGDLKGILFDLIHNHGISDLVVDLSEATRLTTDVSAVLEEAQASVSLQSGHLEIRLADAAALPELPDDIAAFVALDQEGTEIDQSAEGL